MKSLYEILLEKLKVTNKSLLGVNNERTVEVPYYEFVLWYLGLLDKKPDEITADDFRSAYFSYAVVYSNGIKVFKTNRLAYNFYKKHKDDIVTITIEDMRGPASDNGAFLNTVDFEDKVFYVESDYNFKEYVLSLKN